MEKTGKFVPRRAHKNEAVQVVVRCRPLNDKEIAAGYSCVVECFPSRGAIDIFNPNAKDPRENKKSFTYDAVYDWNSTQDDIYEETVRSLVTSVLDGFNGTIFAYGQTGTGKTYTMEGCRTDPTQKGIIPKSFEQIFSHISRSSNVQYLVRTSYLEIYQEEIRDLLNKDQAKKYELRENSDVGVYVKDISSFVCKSVKEIDQVMYIGNQNRKIGATNMNEHSSRSHAIFMITIEMSGIGGKKVIRVGKLNLVDLAGSERQSKTGATGERLKEASKINLSLSALGNVISALVISSGKAPHVPYRDSKLTRILQDSLGGNSKTIMVANIGPASYNYDESLTTLRYANRAKNIKNKPRVNEDPKDALLREYQTEIARLKNLLALRLQERAALSEQQRLGSAQQEKKYEEDPDPYADNKKDKGKMRKATEEEKRLYDEQQTKLLLAHEKLVNQKLEERIQAMESKLLCGGKNIIDHTNEQQRALEQRNQEIAERKKLEVEMRQQIELQEESAVEILETYTTLQQEVEIKTKKLKKLFTKLQAVKQEIHDVTDEFNRDRRELELVQNDLMKDLKVKYLIIENFIPVDEKNKLLARVRYDEEEGTFCISPYEEEIPNISKRPVSADDERRPISDYSRVAIKVGRHHRYHREENCQPVCDFFRSFHSSFPTCVPKGTWVGSEVVTQIAHNLPPQAKALISKSHLKLIPRMSLELQAKVGVSSLGLERMNLPHSHLFGSSTQLSKRTEIAQASSLCLKERECRCGYLLPQTIQTVPYNEFSNYSNTIPLVSCDSSQIECSDDLLYADFRFLTALCCIIYLFRIVYILQIVIIAVISLFSS